MAALALRFAVLTAARTGEVRGMTWGEADLAAAVWTIPGKRMKSGRLHRVPLSGAALAVLTLVRLGTSGTAALVFLSPVKGKALSDMSVSMLTRGMACDGLAEGEPPRWRDAEGRGVVPHRFRSSFRVWAGETRPEGREVVESALAHAICDKSEAAYQRSDLLERRRALMEGWAAFRTRQPGGKVVHLHREAVAQTANRRGLGLAAERLVRTGLPLPTDFLRMPLRRRANVGTERYSCAPCAAPCVPRDPRDPRATGAPRCCPRRH